MGQEYVKLKTLDKLVHYSPSLYFGLAFLLIAALLLSKGVFEIKVLTTIGLFFSIPAAIFYAIQKNKLEFIKIKTSINQNEFKELVKEISNEYKWPIHSQTGHEFTLKTNPGFINQAWGQHVTIKLTTDGILFNSIFDTNKGTWLIPFGSNIKIINDIEKKIKQKTKEHSI